MEAIKGFVFGRGKTPIGYKYLVSFVLISDRPLNNVSEGGETVIMGATMMDYIRQSVDSIVKYKPPYALGDASNAILHVSQMEPDDLERIE